MELRTDDKLDDFRYGIDKQETEISEPILSMSAASMQFNRVVPTSLARWLAIWTLVGALFSLQLRWHYGLSWSLSVFWGIADWYLWSFLALATFFCVRSIRKSRWSLRNRLVTYIVAAPGVAALHVILTMIVGGAASWPDGLDWSGYFTALYAKKLTLNLLTFGVLAAVGELLVSHQRKADLTAGQVSFMTKSGNLSRLVMAGDILRGEVCGNYVYLHTTDGAWPVQQSLTQLMAKLPEGEFLKVSRSSFVSLACVRSTCTSEGKLSIILSDGAHVPVSRRQHAVVRRAIRAQTND